MSAVEIEIDEDEFEDQLNQDYENVIVIGMSMQPGTVLREMDYVAFRQMLNDTPISWKCSECGAIYDEEREAEECWETCCDTVECDQCGNLIKEDDAFHDKNNETYFCTMHHYNLYQKNLESHLGDEE